MKLADLPNLLTVIRILLVVPLVWLLAREHYPAALVVFLIAGFTDGLDGFLAKHFGWSSELGGWLDPVADKWLLVSVFITLAMLGLVPVWLFATVLARDIAIISGGVSYRLLIGPLSASPTGVSKANTAVQLLFVLAAISQAAFGQPPAVALTVLGAIVFVTTVVSGLDYVWAWGRRAWFSNEEIHA